MTETNKANDFKKQKPVHFMELKKYESTSYREVKKPLQNVCKVLFKSLHIFFKFSYHLNQN